MTFVEGTLADDETYDTLDEYGPLDAVLHLAGQSSGETSFYELMRDFESHALNTFKLLRWCESTGIDRLLYASSMSVYGDVETQPVNESTPVDPKSYYAAGKLSVESYIKFFENNGLDTTIFRLFNVYGSGQNIENMQQGMVSIYLSFVLRDETLTVKESLNRFRDFVYVEDVVDAWVVALEDPATFGETYNLACGERTTVEELINCMLDQYGVEEYPIKVVDGTPGDQFGIYGDTSKLRADTGWEPTTSLAAGLREVIEYYR